MGALLGPARGAIAPLYVGGSHLQTALAAPVVSQRAGSFVWHVTQAIAGGCGLRGGATVPPSRGQCLKIIFVLAPGFLRTIFSQCLCCDYQAVSSMDAKSSITSGDESESNVSSLGQRSQVGMIVPTDSDEEQQGARTNGDHLKSLPRSLRWRIQLGILHDPIASTNFAKNAKESICNLNSILSHNEDEISRQAERFKNLVEKYTEETSEVDNEHPDLSPSMPSDKFEFDSTSNSAEVDPLTAMVMEKEAQETRKAELYLKYRKERARMKRGLATEARVIESESDEVDRATVSGYNVYC